MVLLDYLGLLDNIHLVLVRRKWGAGVSLGQMFLLQLWVCDCVKSWQWKEAVLENMILEGTSVVCGLTLVQEHIDMVQDSPVKWEGECLH